jgi:TRAP-type C4-dicarboxylate transport system substrate-binding protein
MKRHLGLSLVLFAFLAGLIVVSVPGRSLAQEVIKLNFANFFPAPEPHSGNIEAFGKEIEQKTNGRVKFTFFHAGTLAPADQIYDSVVKGISDLGMSCFTYTRGKFPLTSVTDLPLGLQNGVTATRMANAYFKKFMPKECDEVKMLYVHAHGPGLIHTTKKPIATLEDLKGMKIRSTGLASKLVLALGAAPVGTTMPETYDALRTGVAEGATAPIQALKGFRWGEVISYTILNYGSSYSTGFFVAMNKKKWDALPPDIQKIFEQASEERSEKTGALWDSTDQDGIKFITEKGVKMLPLSKEENARWAEAVKPLLNAYVDEMKGKNLPGAEALKFCQDYIKANPTAK